MTAHHTRTVLDLVHCPVCHGVILKRAAVLVQTVFAAANYEDAAVVAVVYLGPVLRSGPRMGLGTPILFFGGLSSSKYEGCLLAMI